MTSGRTGANSSSHDGMGIMLGLASGKEAATFTGEGHINCCDDSLDGRTIVFGENAESVHMPRLEGKELIEECLDLSCICNPLRVSSSNFPPFL